MSDLPLVFAERIAAAGQSQTVAIETLSEDPANARLHPDPNLDAIKTSLLRHGQQKPIVHHEGVVIAGNGTLRAALALGWKRVWAVATDLKTDAERLSYAIADNRTAELADWNYPALLQSLERLGAEGGDDYLVHSGWNVMQLEEVRFLANRATPPTQVDPDDVPPQRSTTIRSGDLFELGAHRLLCGDSTDAADVARVMGEHRAVLLCTDPPYGVDYGDIANSRERAADKRRGGTGKIKRDQSMQNDDLEGVDLQKFLEASLHAALPMLAENPAIYLWHPMLTQAVFYAAAAASIDMQVHRQIIWVKPSLILGRGDYHWRHELCFYGWIRGRRCAWYGERDQTTVWEISRERGGEHPTQKPVELFRRPIRNHCRPGEWILEPFGGSGSQLIAAEELGVSCAALEIKPEYCQVIIDRWEAFTGKKATRLDAEEKKGRRPRARPKQDDLDLTPTL